MKTPLVALLGSVTLFGMGGCASEPEEGDASANAFSAETLGIQFVEPFTDRDHVDPNRGRLKFSETQYGFKEVETRVAVDTGHKVPMRFGIFSLAADAPHIHVSFGQPDDSIPRPGMYNCSTGDATIRIERPDGTAWLAPGPSGCSVMIDRVVVRPDSSPGQVRVFGRFAASYGNEVPAGMLKAISGAFVVDTPTFEQESTPASP